MAWLIPWLRWVPRAGTAISPVEKGGPGFFELLKQRSVWGTCGGLFGANYVLYFEITWLPFYLQKERHFSMGTLAKISGAGYCSYSPPPAVFSRISVPRISAHDPTHVLLVT